MSRPTIAPQSDFQCLVVEQALARSAPPGQTLDFCDASFSTRPPVLHDTSPLLCTADPLVLQRHVRQLSMAQVIIFQELKSFLRISIRTWLMDQNPCETSHFLAIGVVTQRCTGNCI